MGYHPEEIEDRFPTGINEYKAMLTYSAKNKVSGLNIISCENTQLQKRLMACCTEYRTSRNKAQFFIHSYPCISWLFY
ncbi:MAG: hypothetical protein ACI92O_001499 [Colwellia sp.]|jgi:hypothetical protein|tara:strand:+ start:3525 stop:3758 length:234 start_codon:yes stop_codon:yes gene_type:complete